MLMTPKMNPVADAVEHVTATNGRPKKSRSPAMTCFDDVPILYFFAIVLTP